MSEKRIGIMGDKAVAQMLIAELAARGIRADVIDESELDNAKMAERIANIPVMQLAGYDEAPAVERQRRSKGERKRNRRNRWR